MKNHGFFRNRYLFVLDLIGYFAAYCLTVILAVSASRYGVLAKLFLIPFLVSCIIFVVTEVSCGIYRIMWRYCSVTDGLRLLETDIIAFALSVSAFLLYEKFAMGIEDIPAGYIKFAICFAFLACCAMIFVRACTFIIYRYIRYASSKNDEKMKRLLIVGAGYSATLVIHDLKRNANLNYDIVGLVDDDETKRKCTIGGYRVLGGREHIAGICKTYGVDDILIAMPSATATQRKEIIDICSKTSCKIKTIPSIDQMIINGKFRMRDIEIDDLLERDEIKLQSDEISKYIEGRVVLVTGGGGSIGSELCRQIVKFDPKKLVVLDIYENNAYDIQMELSEKYGLDCLDVVIASVRDEDRLWNVFEKYKPEIVFHAAAHKHVPLMENSPSEAIRNNVIGTYNVAKCADRFGCRKFVMISTDKAVNPTNIMGATKRMCEMIVSAMQKNSKTEFVSVRFGNVLNSNGSVVPLFKRQIAKGGPVTVTHKEITRFFMTIPEAAQLVIQAGAYAKGGEIFVLDMGKPVKIYDLAKNIIRLSGYRPGIDIEIQEIGLRPGEKLYEEVLMNEEGLSSTAHSKIFIGHQTEIDIDEVEEKLKFLSEAADTQDREVIREALHRAVPTFKEPEAVNNAVMAK